MLNNYYVLALLTQLLSQTTSTTTHNTVFRLQVIIYSLLVEHCWFFSCWKCSIKIKHLCMCVIWILLWKREVRKPNFNYYLIFYFMNEKMKREVNVWLIGMKKVMMLLGVADPSTHPHALGWNVRNLLFALQFTFHKHKMNAIPENKIRILSYRHKRKSFHSGGVNVELSSLVFTLNLPPFGKHPFTHSFSSKQ
jgi:hypothetical protein